MNKKYIFPIFAASAILLSFILFFSVGKIFDNETLLEMHKYGFSAAYISAQNVRIPLTDDEIKKVIDEIQNMKRQQNVGLSGGKWYDYCSLNFRTSKSNKTYRIKFSYRSTLTGVILAKMQSASGNSTRFYGTYNGNNVVKLLNKIALRKKERFKLKKPRLRFCSSDKKFKMMPNL